MNSLIKYIIVWAIINSILINDFYRNLSYFFFLEHEYIINKYNMMIINIYNIVILIQWNFDNPILY